jgi:hypothetical protein
VLTPKVDFALAKLLTIKAGQCVVVKHQGLILKKRFSIIPQGC